MKGIAMAVVLQQYCKLKNTDRMSFGDLCMFLTGSTSFGKGL